MSFHKHDARPDMVTVSENGRDVFVWVSGGRWFWGYDFDHGTNGPFSSYDAAIEDWRKALSRERGKQKDV